VVALDRSAYPSARDVDVGVAVGGVAGAVGGRGAGAGGLGQRGEVTRRAGGGAEHEAAESVAVGQQNHGLDQLGQRPALPPSLQQGLPRGGERGGEGGVTRVNTDLDVKPMLHHIVSYLQTLGYRPYRFLDKAPYVGSRLSIETTSSEQRVSGGALPNPDSGGSRRLCVCV